MSNLSSNDCRNDCRATWYGEPFVVAIDRMRDQLIERAAGLDVEVSANEKLKRSPIATVELELVRTIVGQSAIQVLQQADQIEQRSDVRVRLAIVVTEQAFVVTSQARVSV